MMHQPRLSFCAKPRVCTGPDLFQGSQIIHMELLRQKSLNVCFMLCLRSHQTLKAKPRVCSRLHVELLLQQKLLTISSILNQRSHQMLRARPRLCSESLYANMQKRKLM
ncbi:hypothetical protein Bca4012_000103 [Brassica carinata]|uniref:Uncharacterized protein n=2 Tax=Brassica oleracea TaxID=3712 RepID=A0A0D3AZG2_BRAOL|nr:unnamed protein product [Brassica oleracea]